MAPFRVAMKGSEMRVALRETLAIAVDTLRAHKLRSFLTLLGVILAVATLVAVMSVLNGLNVYVAEKVANLGANAYVIDRVGVVTNFEEWNKARKRPPLQMERSRSAAIGNEAGDEYRGGQQTFADVRHGNDLRENVTIIGTSPSYAEIRDVEVSTGRLLTETDEEHRVNVCIIGADVANQFFPSGDPIGRQIRAGAEQYEVVGVAAPKGTVLGQSLDDFIMMPLSTYRKGWLAPLDSVAMFVQAPTPDLMAASEDEARVLLRARRHVAYGADDNFGVMSPTSLHGHLESHYRERIRDRHLGDVGISGGGRNRDHEHHAGQRDGADARDRVAKIAGRAEDAHPAAISGGVFAAGGAGREHRSAAGADAGGDCALGDFDSLLDADFYDCDRAIAFDHRRACSSGFIRRCARRGWIPLKRCGLRVRNRDEAGL